MYLLCALNHSSQRDIPGWSPKVCQKKEAVAVFLYELQTTSNESGADIVRSFSFTHDGTPVT